MGLLFNLVFAGRATSTHHKLALNALRHLQRHDGDEWQNVFLAEIDSYLKGAKAPDDDFKDFRNHVLHVREKFWGGAIGKAEEWYGKTVQALGRHEWSEAVYNAGVLSHYFTDPFQPFHTAQSEREMIVHRAAEWSIAKSYEELQTLLTKELGGYPQVAVPTGKDWLAQLIRQGAEAARGSYELLLDHYNLEVGKSTPALGFDREAKLAIARLIGQATIGFARVLDRAFAEASVLVPHVVVGLQAIFESTQIPRRAIARRLLDTRERAVIEGMYAEYKRTGKVLATLPDDDRAVRAFYAEEVLKIPLTKLDEQKSEPFGSKYTGPTPAPAKVAKLINAPAVAIKAEAPAGKRDDLNAPKLSPFIKEMAAPTIKAVAATAPLAAVMKPEEASGRKPLTHASPLVDAPSIGPKTADRFAAIGIRTVGEFIRTAADDMARSLNASHLSAAALEEWQDQAQLVVDVPRLLARDAQFVVGVGLRTCEELARCNARDLLDMVNEFCDSSEGKQVLRDADPPDLAEVSLWVVAAKKARMNKAA